MLELLKSADYNPSTISWVDVDNMEFRVNDTHKLGQMWGEEKENPTMNFDKLSRAIRFYYKKKVFQPVTNKRLIYKFGDAVKAEVRDALLSSDLPAMTATAP